MAKAKLTKQNVVLERLKVEYVGIDAVLPNTYNPNRQSEHDFTLLCKSIEEDGFTQPIIVLASSKVIVDGEHRWRAAKHLGYTQVPVVFTAMSPEQARIATLRHNRARGSEDLELAAAVLRDLVKLGAAEQAQESLMLDDVEMQRLLDDVALPDEEVTGAEWLPQAEPPQTLQELEEKRTAERAKDERKKFEDNARGTAESDLYRVSLVFAGPEGGLVRAVLGNRPAIVLLELCQARNAA